MEGDGMSETEVKLLRRALKTAEQVILYSNERIGVLEFHNGDVRWQRELEGAQDEHWGAIKRLRPPETE